MNTRWIAGKLYEQVEIGSTAELKAGDLFEGKVKGSGSLIHSEDGRRLNLGNLGGKRVRITLLEDAE